MHVPSTSAFTTPVADTVAVVVFELDQVPPIALLNKVTCAPIQLLTVVTPAPPLVKLMTGKATTVTSVSLKQPLLFVYLMVDVPTAKALIRPDPFTETVVDDEDVQALVVAAVGEPTNVVFVFKQSVVLPVIVGLGLTVTVLVVEHPPLLVYVITLVPAETPVTKPVLLTVATDGDADTHGLDVAAVPAPVSWVVAPTQTDAVPVMAGAAATVRVRLPLQPLLLV